MECQLRTDKFENKFPGTQLPLSTVSEPETQQKTTKPIPNPSIPRPNRLSIMSSCVGLRRAGSWRLKQGSLEAAYQRGRNGVTHCVRPKLAALSPHLHLPHLLVDHR